MKEAYQKTNILMINLYETSQEIYRDIKARGCQGREFEETANIFGASVRIMKFSKTG